MREHSLKVRVRYGETDQMGVVYHANYFLYFEEARTDLLRAAGFDLAGVPIPPGEFEGTSILAPDRPARPKVFSKRGVDYVFDAASGLWRARAK